MKAPTDKTAEFADLLRGMTDSQFERFKQAVADDLAKRNDQGESQGA